MSNTANTVRTPVIPPKTLAALEKVVRDAVDRRSKEKSEKVVDSGE